MLEYDTLVKERAVEQKSPDPYSRDVRVRGGGRGLTFYSRGIQSFFNSGRTPDEYGAGH